MRLTTPAVTLILTLTLSLAACRDAAAQSPRTPSTSPARPAAPAAAPAPTAPAASNTSAAPAGWYSADPLLVSLRPAARANLAQTVGVARLEDLPLYDLHLALRADDTGFTLREEVYFTNTEPTPLDEVVLRVYANAVSAPGQRVVNPPVRFVRGACTGASCTVTAEQHSVIAVRPPAPIAPGGRLRVTLEFEGTLQRIDAGRTNLFAQGMEGLASMGSSEQAGDYGLLATGDGIVSLGNFYAVLARRSNGRWERGDASTLGDLGSDAMSHVRARVEVASGVRVAATGTITVDTPVAGGRHAVEVSAAMVRDFAVLASPAFEVATRDVGGVTVRSHFLPAERAAGERVLDVAAHALAQFERRFGPYPYADLDVVEAPLVGGAGGVEFAALVTVASMFYRPVAPGEGPLGAVFQMLGGGAGMDHMVQSMLEFVTAHEVAHQYWHGIVGSDSRQHPFVDEGLAQYSAMLYLEDRYGAERARRDGDAQVRMNYQFMRLLGQPDAAVDRPVAAFATPIAYAGLVYGKGPYLYRELRSAVGDAAFFDALRAYVARYRFRLAPPRGFVELLATGRRAARVRALARRWLDESHGDEDLGRADLGGMLAQMLGPEAAGMGPQLQQALELIGGLPGGGGQGRGVAGGAGGGRQPSAQELQQLMQQMQQMLNTDP